VIWDFSNVVGDADRFYLNQLEWILYIFLFDDFLIDGKYEIMLPVQSKKLLYHSKLVGFMLIEKTI